MTNYSSALTVNSSRYGGGRSYYYYESIPINVSATDAYTFISNSTSINYGYLYENSFNPMYYSAQNLVAAYVPNGRGEQFTIFASMRSGTNYSLVIRTSGRSTTGRFSVFAFGTVAVNFL
jgi:hypothetical protein